MEEVLKAAAQQIPLWIAAVQGKPDWQAIFKGYASAVDWPTAAFWPELAAAYPGAKVVLTTRDADSWGQSYAETILKFMASGHAAPAHLRPWFEMAHGVTAKSGFAGKMSQADLAKAFADHGEAVRRSIPARRLLVYEVADGWEPLCQFLGKPVPAAPFPKTNNRVEFWDLARQVTD